MRLSSAEIDAIIIVIRKFIPQNSDSHIFLFGSRTQDHLKGGDIDLAVIIADHQIAEMVANKDYQIISQIKAQPAIGDQKIDLKIINPDQAKNAFFKKALADAILLG